MSDTCRLSSSSGAWVISVASPVGVCATNRSSFVAAHPVGDSGTGLTVSAVDATKPTANSATSVTFNGFGQVANASTAIASVSVTSAVAGSRALTVQVSASGRVRTCDPLTASSDPRSCL
jgi:type IV fimbrial biogenesis protein FimT